MNQNEDFLLQSMAVEIQLPHRPVDSESLFISLKQGVLNKQCLQVQLALFDLFLVFSKSHEKAQTKYHFFLTEQKLCAAEV